MLVVSTHWGFPRTNSAVSAVRDIASLGFEGVELAAEAGAGDALAAASLCREKRVSCRTVAAPFSALPWTDGDPTRGLASPDDTRRQRAVAAVLSSLPAAAEVEAEAITFSLGPAGDVARGRLLDAAARSLFDLTRAESGVTFAIRTPSEAGGFPDPDELELLFEDAVGKSVGYVHDVAAADRHSRDGIDAASWLARHGPRTVSVLLHDRIGDLDRLPPGGGEVDWPTVAAGVSTGMVKVLLVGPNHSGPELLAGAAFLRERGIAS